MTSTPAAPRVEPCDVPRRSTLDLLSERDIDTAFERVLHLLETRGVEVDHAEARALLAAGGAEVDDQRRNVRFPRSVATQAMTRAPRSIACGSKRIGESAAGFTAESLSGTTQYCRDGLTFRAPTLADVAHCAQLSECLEQIGIVAYPIPADVHPHTVNLRAVVETLRNTTKPTTVVPDGEKDMALVFEAALILRGDAQALRANPVLMPVIDATTPFRYKHQDVEWLIQAGRYGQPCRLASAPVAGATSPVTPAGQVMLAATELTASLVISQLLTPGSPVILTLMPLFMDMRTGRAIESLESLLAASALAQFCKHIQPAPVSSSISFSTTFSMDWQQGVQKTLAAVLGALSRSDILIGAGGVSGLATSPVQLIADDTLLRLARRVSQGLDFSDAALAWQDIMATEAGGNFMSRRHTARHCRDTLTSTLLPIVDLERWQSGTGDIDLRDRARTRLLELETQLAPLDLPAEVTRELDRLLAHAQSIATG